MFSPGQHRLGGGHGAGFTGLAGSTNGTGAAPGFYFPPASRSDSEGYLYVADAANNLIRTTRVVAAPNAANSAALGSQFFLSGRSRPGGFVLETSEAVGPQAAALVARDQRQIITLGGQLWSAPILIRARLLSLAPALALARSRADGIEAD